MSDCAENCVVVAEGELQHNGVFRASALGLPPVESRRTSEIAAKARRWFCTNPSITPKSFTLTRAGHLWPEQRATCRRKISWSGGVVKAASLLVPPLLLLVSHGLHARCTATCMDIFP